MESMTGNTFNINSEIRKRRDDAWLTYVLQSLDALLAGFPSSAASKASDREALMRSYAMALIEFEREIIAQAVMRIMLKPPQYLPSTSEMRERCAQVNFEVRRQKEEKIARKYLPAYTPEVPANQAGVDALDSYVNEFAKKEISDDDWSGVFEGAYHRLAGCYGVCRDDTAEYARGVGGMFKSGSHSGITLNRLLAGMVKCARRLCRMPTPGILYDFALAGSSPPLLPDEWLRPEFRSSSAPKAAKNERAEQLAIDWGKSPPKDHVSAVRKIFSIATGAQKEEETWP